MREYLAFQLKTVDSVLDLVWLSERGYNIFEYLVDSAFFTFNILFMQYGAHVFLPSYSNIDRIPRFRRVPKCCLLPTVGEADDILRNT
jgi:hypothetical protein